MSLCCLWLYLVWLINALTSPISSSSFLFETCCCWSCSVNYTRILSLILHLLLTRKQPWCLFQVASRHFSFACWHFSSSSSGPHFHLCCSLLCSRPSLFPFLACWSSAANFTCWCDNTALWNLSLTHTHTHIHSFLVTVENFQSVLCQCRGWWCAVRLWRWTNAFIVALMQSLPPCISSITTQFQIHFPLLWTSCNTFFLLQLCYCNDLSLQFLQTHFLHTHYLFNFHTYSHFCLFLRSSSDSIISSFCPVHLIFIMLHTCHDCSLSLLILRNFD